MSYNEAQCGILDFKGGIRFRNLVQHCTVSHLDTEEISSLANPKIKKNTNSTSKATITNDAIFCV